MDLRYSLGLDVDKVGFKACLKSQEENTRGVVRGSKSFSNNAEGFQELCKWIIKHRKSQTSEIKIVMEATGVYHEHLAWYLYQQDYRVSIILPLRAKRYIQSLGIKSKNDEIDAQGLADMGLQQDLELWQPCSKHILILRSLTRQLEMLMESRTVFINQLESFTHQTHCDKMVIKSLKSLIKTIEKDIDKLKKRIMQFVNEDAELSKKYKLVEPMKGLAMITFATLVAETGGFELFESQAQLVSYAGYDVVENKSGSRVGKTRISKKGNTHIRRIMFMAAFNVVRYKVSPFYQIFERVYEKTKVKMKAYVAVQRKLLCIIYALWKNDSIFDPEYLKRYSGNQEPKPLFSVGPQGPETKVANGNALATLDELP